MSDFLDEEVPPVRPLGMVAIEEVGRCFLEYLAPEVLTHPQSLHVADLIDTRLPDYGIHVCPASREELGDRAGATDPQGDGEIDILIQDELWEKLDQPGPTSYYAKTTVCHEIGHAVLHVPVLRRRLIHTEFLARVQRRSLKAYEDPEWQAWAFAGAILMPSPTLRLLEAQHKRLTPELISEVYDVSHQMAKSHLRRLKWPSAGR